MPIQRNLPVCMAFLLAGVFAAAPAAAQPDPFAAWEASQGGAPPLPGEAPLGPSAPFAAGNLTFGVGGSFAFTTSTTELAGGGEADNSTLFMRLTPELGWFVAPRVELVVAPGLVWQRLDRGAEGDSTDSAWLLEAKVRYHLPVSERLSLLGGVGLGGYFGGASRTVRITELLEDGRERPRRISESTDTSGFSLSTQVGAGYFFDPRFQLRLTADLHWLIGSEEIEGGAKDLSSTTTHAGLGASVVYFFWWPPSCPRSGGCGPATSGSARQRALALPS